MRELVFAKQAAAEVSMLSDRDGCRADGKGRAGSDGIIDRRRGS